MSAVRDWLAAIGLELLADEFASRRLNDLEACKVSGIIRIVDDDGARFVEV